MRTVPRVCCRARVFVVVVLLDLEGRNRQNNRQKTRFATRIPIFISYITIAYLLHKVLILFKEILDIVFSIRLVARIGEALPAGTKQYTKKVKHYKGTEP